jgi:hypothetical protein
MSKKRTPSALREEAKKLMQKAVEEERARHQRIGELFVSHMENSFNGFDLAVFKEEAAKLWKG